MVREAWFPSSPKNYIFTTIWKISKITYWQRTREMQVRGAPMVWHFREEKVASVSEISRARGMVKMNSLAGIFFIKP